MALWLKSLGLIELKTGRSPQAKAHSKSQSSRRHQAAMCFRAHHLVYLGFGTGESYLSMPPPHWTN